VEGVSRPKRPSWEKEPNRTPKNKVLRWNRKNKRELQKTSYQQRGLGGEKQSTGNRQVKTKSPGHRQTQSRNRPTKKKKGGPKWWKRTQRTSKKKTTTTCRPRGSRCNSKSTQNKSFPQGEEGGVRGDLNCPPIGRGLKFPLKNQIPGVFNSSHKGAGKGGVKEINL